MASNGIVSNLRTLLPYIAPDRPVLVVMLGLLLAGSLLSLANPWMAGLVTASVIGEQATEVQLLLGLWLALMILRSLLSFVSQYYIGGTTERITARLRTRLYQHLQALPVGYYQQRRSGDTLTLLSTDAAIIASFVTDTLLQLLPALLTFGGALLLMAWLDFTIALIALLLLPLYVLAMKLISRRLRPLSRAWVQANADMVSLVQENLGMLPAIKAFTREMHEQGRFDSANTQLLSVARRQMKLGAILEPAVGLLSGLGLLGLLWLGTNHIEAGRLQASQLVSLLLYAMLLVTPLRTLANVYGQLQRTLGSAERILEFLAVQPEPTEEGGLVLSGIKGSIQFDNVSYSYPGRPSVLRDFNLTIDAGETVAITGPNGAGKSTLAHLLLRFADPRAGRILVDEVDIRQLRLMSLREHIGLVAQHTLLLNGTVAQNIAYGDPAVAQQQVEWASRAAHAHQFIAELPNGYDTLIGDQGVRLSGGQRQRVALARTLLRNPPILILDEATAMFDPQGEQAFIAECRDLLASRTVILITHRPASLALADRVVTMGS